MPRASKVIYSTNSLGYEEYWVERFKCPICQCDDVSKGYRYCPFCGVKLIWRISRAVIKKDNKASRGGA